MAFDSTAINALAPIVVAATCGCSVAWLFNNWLRMRHGYPLENSWGKAIYPKERDEARARIQLLTRENAQLSAEIGSIKDRLASVERIVTEEGYDLARQIEGLRAARNEVTTQ